MRHPEGWVHDETTRHRRARRFGPAGNLLMRYRWPKSVPSVVSPYLSWENLDLCGGWTPLTGWTRPVELERVLAGAKPLAVAGVFVPSDSERLALIERAASVARDRGLLIEQREGPPDFRGVVARQFLIGLDRTFEELFDLDAVAAAYRAAGPRFAPDLPVITSRSGMATMKVREAWFWDPAIESQLEPAQVIALGLALGYPIESTIAILSGTI